MAQTPDDNDQEKMPAALMLGIGVTLGWAILLAIYLMSSSHSLADIWNLDPNEFGDFLAGAFAPVAFLWLAVAVLLQRRELQLQRHELVQNRDALEQQAKELRETVKENAAQAKSLEASKEYARQETIIRVSEHAMKSLSLLACNMWHEFSNIYRSSSRFASNQLEPQPSNYWERYASGDTDIWFAALFAVLRNDDEDNILELVYSSLSLRGQAESFLYQSKDAASTLQSLGAPSHMIEAFDSGYIGQLEPLLRQLCESHDRYFEQSSTP